MNKGVIICVEALGTSFLFYDGLTSTVRKDLYIKVSRSQVLCTNFFLISYHQRKKDLLHQFERSKTTMFKLQICSYKFRCASAYNLFFHDNLTLINPVVMKHFINEEINI